MSLRVLFGACRTTFSTFFVESTLSLLPLSTLMMSTMLSSSTLSSLSTSSTSSRQVSNYLSQCSNKQSPTSSSFGASQANNSFDEKTVYGRLWKTLAGAQAHSLTCAYIRIHTHTLTLTHMCLHSHAHPCTHTSHAHSHTHRER